jgi:hypothetical protein
MGKGSEGDAEVNERLHGQSTEPARDFYGLAEEHDEASRTAQRRRAGNRFRYRRRSMAAHNVRTVDDAPYYEYVSAALRRTLVLVCVQIILGTFASGPDTGSDRTLVRTAVVQMSYISSSISYLHTSPHGSSADALRSATFDLTTVNTDFRYAHATLCYDRSRPASARSCLQLQQTCPDVHLQPLPMIYAYHRPRLLGTAPPIASSRPHARPHRTDSSSAPASPRPAAPSTCRPDCPSRPAWTRPPLSRSAQRLRASKPCHSVPDGTPCTFQKYDRKKNEKKTPNNSCNNVLQEPDGGVRAQRTGHQLWPRANLAYAFLVQQPLAPHNHCSLRAGTRAANTGPLAPSHTLQHGRLQRTDGPSPKDCGLRGQSLVPPSPPFTQAATSLATPGRQPTWGSPATLLADLVGAWLGTRAQRQRDRHGTPSAPAVQIMGTPASAVSQTPGLGSGGGDDGDVRTHNFSSASSLPSPAGEQHMDTLVLAADQTPGLGSGGGDAGPARTHSTLQPPGTRRPSQPCRRDSTSAAGLYSSAREQCMDTPTLAADQTPGLGSGGGATDHAGTHFVLQPPRDRCSSRQSLQHSISAVSLSFRARGRYIDSPTLAADQTPGLGSGGGDTRPVRVHLALQPPGTRVTLTRSISTPATPSSDPALTVAHSRILGSALQQTLHCQAPSQEEALRVLDAHILGLDTLATTAPQALLETATTAEPTSTSCSTLSATAPGHARPPDVPHA